MSSRHIIIVSLILQTLLINNINGNAIRRRRQQASGTQYGNLNNPAGYNYPGNTNFYGTNLNNQGSSNPLAPANTNSLNNPGLNNQQQPQLYGTNNQQLPNPSYNSNGLYSGNAANQNYRDANGNVAMRDSNGNIIPTGSAGSSLYSSSNSQLGYSANNNQLLTNKDMLNPNTNQYGYGNSLYPNNAQMSSNTNNNNNLWPNNNNNNQYNTNAGNSWNPNRDLNKNNNNAYSNLNSPYTYYNSGHQQMISYLSLFLATAFLYI